MVAKLVRHSTGELGMEANGTKLVGQSERRKCRRAHVRWPVRFLQRNLGDADRSVTENVSSIGFFAFSKELFVPGEFAVCILEVPAYDPKDLDRVLCLECKVRIVRVDAVNAEGFYGVACRIQDYRFLSGL